MEFIKPLSPVIPVFLLVAVGFIFAHWKKISLASVTEIIVYLGTPSLVFSSLASKPLYAGDIAVLSAGILIIFAGVGVLIRLYFFVFGFTSRGFALPTLFMNAGNMGIPLALFAFGQEGMQRATLMFVIITFLQYSLGIYILNGSGNWTEIFRLPLIYAAIAGLFVQSRADQDSRTSASTGDHARPSDDSDHAHQPGLSAVSSRIAPVGPRSWGRAAADIRRLRRRQSSRCI